MGRSDAPRQRLPCPFRFLGVEAPSRSSTCDLELTLVTPMTGAFPANERALRRLRKAAGLTQVTLAAAIRRSQSYLSAIERGEVPPTAGDVARLSAVLGSDVNLYFAQTRKGRA